LREIKAKHGNPDWFADPQISYLNEMNLKECKIKENEKFIIEFVCPIGYEVQSLKEELDTLKSLVNVEVRITSGYGLGSQLESIKNLNKCMEDG
jgi:lipid II:glycine glycyltransferase (peptidoglycan interpeptide bridge formation enzyme)